jgi:hypothetical protein
MPQTVNTRSVKRILVLREGLKVHWYLVLSMRNLICFLISVLSSSSYAQVIRRLSKASLKAGWSDAVPDFFDFRLDVSKCPEPFFLVEQLTHYLSEINTKET